MLEGEEGARQVQLSPYGVVDPAENLVYNNAGPYFRALFDWMMGGMTPMDEKNTPLPRGVFLCLRQAFRPQGPGPRFVS